MFIGLLKAAKRVTSARPGCANRFWIALRSLEHRSHKTWLEVDVRPVRKDGKRTPVYWQSTDQYDQAATARLIELFRAYPGVRKVYFNDPELHHLASPLSNHDNHFHVELRV